MRPALLSLVLSAVLLPASAGNVQKPGLTSPPGATQGKEAVKKLFTQSYASYTKHAFGHDDLLPVSKSFEDDRNGWGATIVDAMDTMLIMGLDDLFTQAVNFSSKIDFSISHTQDTVSVFETTIRYLGGFLSAHELSGKKYPILVQKAKEVADKMAFAWVGTNDVPYGFIDFNTSTPTVDTSNIAEAGTLALEWATLTKYTGNDTYRQLAEKSLRRIAQNPDPLPGLAAQGIDPTTGKPVGGYVTWGGGSDSYFEYLIKYPRLFNLNDPVFVNTWQTAVDSSIRTLLKTSVDGKWTYLADFDDKRQIRHIGSHLACFHGGNWILGGKLLNNQTIVDIGLKLVDACLNTYTSTATGIGPEVFAFTSQDGGFTGGPPANVDDIAFNKQHGFYVFNGGSDYIMRPEVLESNFYAWRATGDLKHVKFALAAVNSFNKFLKTDDAFSGINDVRQTNGARIDTLPSFWFAETLKYLYLTFDDPNHISLDKFVFNTEAHPYQAPTSRGSYATGAASTTSDNGEFTINSGKLPAVSPVPKAPLINNIIGSGFN